MNESYYAKQFAAFDANGGKFRWTWNGAAFFFGGLWQLFRGLYVKFLLYGLALYFLEFTFWKILGPRASLAYPALFLVCLFTVRWVITIFI